MTSPRIPATTGTGTSRIRLFRILAATIALLLPLIIAEVYLGFTEARLRASDRMDTGLIRFHPEFGWTLVPGWQGNHRHADFSAHYRIGSDGFRHMPEASGKRPEVLILGDSFTFGLGVGDADPFPALLHTQSAAGFSYRNLGVPGYSTDQQVLMAQLEMGFGSSTGVVLVVYVVNDFLDNLHEFPLQASMPKPRFPISDDGRLGEVLSPDPSKPKPTGSPTLESAILGTQVTPGWAYQSLRGLRILTLAREHFVSAAPLEAALRQRCRQPVALFTALVDQLNTACQKHGKWLRVVLLPGRSYFGAPQGLSAAFQRAAIDAALEGLGGGRIPVLNLGGLDGDRRALTATDYFPHDGHLTPEGHRKVAAQIEAWLLAEQRTQPGVSRE